MNDLTNEDFIKQIDDWKKVADEEGVTLISGSLINKRFFHVFLGISLSQLSKLTGLTSSKRTVPKYIAKSVGFINKLSKREFINEIKSSVDEYYEVYKK